MIGIAMTAVRVLGTVTTAQAGPAPEVPPAGRVAIIVGPGAMTIAVPVEVTIAATGTTAPVAETRVRRQPTATAISAGIPGRVDKPGGEATRRKRTVPSPATGAASAW